jgi:hypothetical protein
VSGWIDRLRDMLDEPLVNCEQAVRDVVNCELDALELQLLREAIGTAHVHEAVRRSVAKRRARQSGLPFDVYTMTRTAGGLSV